MRAPISNYYFYALMQLPIYLNLSAIPRLQVEKHQWLEGQESQVLFVALTEGTYGFEYILYAHLCLPETAFSLYLSELKNPLIIARGIEYEKLNADKVGTSLSMFANPFFFFALSPSFKLRSLSALHEQSILTIAKKKAPRYLQ